MKISQLPTYPDVAIVGGDLFPVNHGGVTYLAPISKLPVPQSTGRKDAVINGTGAGQETGLVTMSKVVTLLKLVSTGKMRLRIYTTVAARNADLSRGIGVTVPQNSGLLFEGVTSDEVLAFDTTPVPTLVNGEATPTNTFAYTLDPNQATPYTVTLTYLELQT